MGKRKVYVDPEYMFMEECRKAAELLEICEYLNTHGRMREYEQAKELLEDYLERVDE